MEDYVRLGLIVEVLTIRGRCLRNSDVTSTSLPASSLEIALRVTLGIFGSLNYSLQLKCIPKGWRFVRAHARSSQSRCLTRLV